MGGVVELATSSVFVVFNNDRVASEWSRPPLEAQHVFEARDLNAIPRCNNFMPGAVGATTIGALVIDGHVVAAKTIYSEEEVSVAVIPALVAHHRGVAGCSGACTVREQLGSDARIIKRLLALVFALFDALHLRKHFREAAECALLVAAAVYREVEPRGLRRKWAASTSERGATHAGVEWHIS